MSKAKPASHRINPAFWPFQFEKVSYGRLIEHRQTACGSLTLAARRVSSPEFFVAHNLTQAEGFENFPHDPGSPDHCFNFAPDFIITGFAGRALERQYASLSFAA